MKKLITTFSILLSVTSLTVLAHSEHGKARFVAPQGVNKGKCEHVLRPCKTIAYAVQQANKGDKVLVAAGKYVINSSEELFYLSSKIVPVSGGYNRFDHFQSQSPKTNITTLLGVPSDMADTLRKQGFAVISDGKSFQYSADFNKKMAAYKMLNQQQSALTCTNNLAGSFACNNIDLLAHMPLQSFSSSPSAANDIWGHTDLNTGDEYAIIGLNNGVAVVNVSDPENPVEVGTIRGKSDIWRDIKVFQYFDENLNLWRAYAYATIDNSSDYVTIIDLNHLPNSVSLVAKTAIVAQAHNVYISNVDHSLNISLPNTTPSLQLTGARQVNGASKFGGAFHSYSLLDPENPILLTNSSAGQGYTHDGTSLLINDNRANTNCHINNGACSVFIDFNEKEMKVWNISDPSSTSLLGSAEYNDVSKNDQYIHSGWATEDNQYVFVQDEFDEYRGGLNSTLRIFSLDELSNPQQVGQWTGPTRAIDHNGFVRGNRYYMSNYERGLTVLDISDPKNPQEIGFFDTFTPADSASFNGAWGTYPFLPSGNILVSDINSGLYILKDNTRNSPQGSLTFTTANIEAAQGESLSIKVKRQQGVDNEVSVAYEVLAGSAKEGEDYTPTTGVLTWADQESSDKIITINVAADTTGNEFAETFFVRLYNPTNGATLSSPSYLTVNVAGKIDNGAISFVKDSETVAENQSTINIEVNRDGSHQGETSATYHLESDSAIVGQDVEESSGTLTWLDGEADTKTISINLINDDIEESDEQFSLVLTANEGSSLGANNNIVIKISDDDRNTAPIVNTNENFQVNAGQSVTLSASASDPENDNLTYLWNQTSGTNVELSNSDQLSASFIAPNSAGDLSFKLTVTDTKGLQSSDTIVVSVIKPPTNNSSTENKSSGGSSSVYLLMLIACFTAFRRKK